MRSPPAEQSSQIRTMLYRHNSSKRLETDTLNRLIIYILTLIRRLFELISCKYSNFREKICRICIFVVHLHANYAIMVTSNKFSIDYMSLPNGLHTFDFEVDDALFGEMESNEIKGGDCKVHACINCSDAKLDVNVMISGSVVVECDRCLEDCNIPVEFSGLLTVRFSDLQHDYDGDVMWIAKGDQLSLKQYIYESIVISLPYRRVHEEGGCNPEMIARFTASDADEE